MSLSLPPELVSQSEANMLALLRCDETRNLRFLSEGLVTILDKCDLVFLDTNVLLNGVSTFKSSPLPTKCLGYHNQKGEFTLHSVSRMLHAYRGTTEGNRVIKNLYDYIAEDILRGDLNLQIFEGAFRCRNVMLPEQAFREASRNYSLARRQVAFEEGRENRLFRYNPPRNRKTRRDRGVKLKSEKELISRSVGQVDPSIVRCIKGNLERLTGILTFAQLNDRIAEDSGIFPANAQYSDQLIIDEAMQYAVTAGTTYPIGIVTHDSGFERKVRGVIGERISRGLEIPQVYLLIGFRNLEAYQLLKVA